MSLKREIRYSTRQDQCVALENVLGHQNCITASSDDKSSKHDPMDVNTILDVKHDHQRSRTSKTRTGNPQWNPAPVYLYLWRSNSGNKPSFSKVPSKTKVSENVQFFPCRKNTSNANQVTLILQWNAARIHPLEHMPVLGALQAPQGLQALPWRFQGHRVSGCYQCDHCKSLANLENSSESEVLPFFTHLHSLVSE